MLKTQYLNQKHVVSILVILLIAFAHLTSYADVTSVTDRTPQVRDAIVAAVPGINTASDVTETHLAAITALDLRAAGISALKTGDFSGLTGLTNLNLYNNELSSLPDDIFKGLTALTTLRLGRNTVDPMPITVSLEKVGEDQFKVVVPTGAPFDIVLPPLSAMNGSIASEATNITISKGSTESSALTVSRTVDTTAAVTVDVGTLPSLPLHHYGYVLSKSDALPLEVIGEVTTTPVDPDPPVVPDPDPPVVPDPDPPVVPDPDPPTPTNTAPMFSGGDITTRIVAENTAAGVNIGSAVAATDADTSDTLTYTLSGIDATAFDIDSTTGQLTTKAALDYETKRVYSVSITVSDGNLTDTIRVIISIIDTADTPLVSMSLPVSQRTPQVRDAIVAAVPGVTFASAVTEAHLATITSLDLRGAGISKLKTGDFSGLTGLTSLNLYNNMLSSLPNGIFAGLTSLTSLRLGGNLIDPLPLMVSLQQVDANQFQAVIPTSAPFNVVLPVSAMMVTIPKGSFTSAPFTVVDMATVNIDALPSLPANHFGYAFSKSTVCNRTPEVAEAIAAAVPDVTDCRNVNDIQLATITSLDLSGKGITALSSDDFAGMLSLTTLNLSNNILSSLPDGIFDDLPSLTTLDLSGNSVSPFPFTVSLQKVGENMLKTVVPTGAPFDIAVPVIIKTGNTLTGTINLTIPQGSRESQLGTVTRTAGTTAAVTADIGTLPSLPATHTGYVLVKTNQQPLEVLSDINVAPVFTAGVSATRSIAENTAAGTNIGEPISATDADNDTLAYSLGGTDASAFAIDTKSGQLKTNAALDYETRNSYSVAITVSDGKRTDTISVTISVTDVDEKPETDDPVTTKDPTPTNNAPVFTAGESATRSIAENTGAGVDIGSAVAATDADGHTLTWTLGGTDAAAFSIDSTTGQLRTSAALDYETKTSYSVTITVSDGSLTDTISATIAVTDVDETPANTAPVFTAGNSTTRSIAENTGAGIDIGTAVSANDTDNDALTYSLSGTDAASFSIDSTTGQLRTEAALDYETKSSYSVTITVSDGSLTDTISVTIAVTDVDETPANTAPVFTAGNSTTRSIAENTGAGIDIGTAVSANDTDNDALTYSLSGTDAASFSIDSTTGQLRTEAALDYETKSSYSVTITVSDGSLTDTISVTIAVTDVDETPSNTAPVFTDGDNTNRSVAENTGAGIDIGTVVSANDTDNDALTYSLGSIDAASFSIDSTTGQLRTEAALDYETKSSYSVTITVSDGSLTDTISVTIAVTDIDETPANTAPVFTDGDNTNRSVAENTGAGINIGTVVSANDTDNDALTYSLGSIDAASFSIDSTTGQLRTEAALDYETKSSYSVAITVSDGKGGTDTITVTVNITDIDEAPANSAPEFAPDSTTLTIAEDAGAGVNIGSAITATDAENDTLIYSLGGTDAASFEIDSSSGQLRTSAALDYESKSSYSVTVIASDGTLTDSITVTINVTNVNEAPAFSDGASTTRAIAENVLSDINIGSAVAATDPEGSKLTYTLGGTDAASFSIDSATGQLKTKVTLDYEKKTSYSVTINVSDGSLTDTITVTINVTDLDNEVRSNNAPAFIEGDSTTRPIAENTGSDVAIGSAISAEDADNNTLAYFLSGDDASAFSIDDSSGQLLTSAALNYEAKSSYTVTVTVSDGNLTDTITVTISITDVNEAPVISDSADTTLSIAENTATGVNIGGTLSATDPDDGDTLEYSLGGTDAASFSIDSTSGQLRTKTALDYEKKTSYSVTITVSDGRLTDTINVTINVTDVDDNRAPVFTDGESTTRAIDENTGSGVNIGSAIAATDADNDDLTYTLGGTDASSFSINSTNGQLRTKSALDYEKKTSYSVTITVSDGRLTDTINVTINVTDVDDNHAPVFTDGESTTRAIDENTGSGVNIGSAIAATDADNDDLTYTLGGTDASSFGINSTNGQLRTKSALDYEKKTSYSVTITVSDGSLTDTIAVTINVTDVDDNHAPVFTDGESTTRAIDENTGSGVNIGGAVSATDADNDTLEYSLGGTDAVSFSINSTTGQLRTNAALNYEKKTSYSVTITVSDGNGGTDSITVTINVTNVNEAPVFADGDSITRSVAENVPVDTVVARLSVTDPDDDAVGALMSESSLQSDGFFKFKVEFSKIETNKYDVVIKTRALLDYETQRTYELKVGVVDVSVGSNLITVTINVDNVNEAPAFTERNPTREIAENTAVNQEIGSPIVATDPDVAGTNTDTNPDTTDADTLEYSLGGDDAASFGIDSETGQLKTKAALDYEMKTSYSVTITVSDGRLTDTINVTINVTDVDDNHAPVFTDGESTTRAIDENTGSGVNIGSAIAATDADNDDLTYTLGGTDASSFGINSTNGQLRTKSALDYEKKTSYSVTITVSDGSLTDTIAVTINVTDVDDNHAPVFTDGESTTRAIDENTGSGVNIGGAVSATDADNDTLEYSLGGTDAVSFSINSTTGQLRTNAALNYEKKTSYSVTITVSDGNGGTDSITVTINVTNVNEAPVFADGDSITRSVAENVPVDTVVARLSVTDPDDDAVGALMSESSLQSDGFFKFKVEFSKIETNKYDVVIKTRALLDYETQRTYELKVGVVDVSVGSNLITVTINVDNVNEAPAFTERNPTREIAENTAVNQEIGSPIVATDPDVAGTNTDTNPDTTDADTLEYSLGGDDAASFGIDSETGQLKTKAALDYEMKTSYSVTITVSDGRLTDTINVTINVTDVDDNHAPVFTDGESTTRAIDENTGSGVNIGSAIAATDADNDDLTYTLGGTDAGSFGINSTNGQLRTKSALDYERKTSYSMTINVSDGNGGTDSISVTINITNVNEAPVFSDGSSTTRSVAENTAANTNIGNAVSATDVDSGDTLTYTLGGTDAASFGIVSTTGQLQTSAVLDYDTKNTYSVTITVSDGNGGTDTINVTISVTDSPPGEDKQIDPESNSVPVFTDGSSTTRSVAENTNAGENIGTAVAATDDDNDPLTYTLGGDDAASFDIVSTTGQLQTKAALNYDTKNTYTVTITVSDGNGGTDTITVTINVTDVEDTLITERTSQVRNAIVAAVPGVSSAADVTETHLAAITKLELNSVGLTGLKDGDFNGLTGLTKLEIEHNQSLEALPSGIFDELTSLTELSLLDNDLSSLPSGVFNGLTGLTKLEIERNQSLEALPSGVFDELTSLTELSLLDNDLSSLPSGVFDELTSLTRLNLQDNQLRSLPSGIFDNLTQLETLNLNYNSLRSLPDDIFSNLTNLLYLWLEDNSLRSLPDDIFDGLTQLTSLDLSGNSITSFLPDVFDDLTALTRLDLQVNRFTSLPSGIFDSLTQLDTLDLEGSSRGGYLSSLPSGIFDNLTQLTRLDLGNNRLSSLPDGIFSNLTNLLYLYLDSNSLRSLPDGIFENLTRLVELDLKWNARNPLQSTVSLEKVGDAQFKAVVSTGAPFSIVLPISVTRGSISGGSTQATVSSEADNAEEGLTIIVPRGSRESAPIDVTRTTGTTEAVTVDIGTLPGLSTHFGYPAGTTEGGKRIVIGGLRPYNSGYTFVKSSGLPLEVIAAGAAAINKQINPNNVPVFTESSPSRSIEIDGDTAAGANIGDPVSATDTDNDTLTYTLGGTDASLFSIVSSSGQLQTTAALISGTQSVYSVTVTANDGNGGSASVNVGVTVTRSDDITSVSDRTQQVQDAIVAAVPDVTSANDVTETHLAAITVLDLWREGISELKAGDFDGLTALEELYLDSNFSLSSLPDGIFDELTALKTLNLSTIIISSLPSGIFDELTALEKLYLFQTRLTSVPADVFDELTALKELDMGYNRRLTSLPAGVFDNLTALTTLYFSEAERLTSFPDGIFDELTALTYLEIAGSCKSVETLPDNVFNNLTNLTYLDVSSNNLTSWPDGIAGNLTALETLALYNNSLSSWPDDVFDGFTALTTLSLFNNSFGSLPDGIFDELTNLSTLWLGSNGLSSLPDGIFDNNTQLKDLSLGNNQLTTLPDGIFDNNTALTTLSLYKNSLTALSSDIFQNLTNLSTLMLYENKLTTLPDGIFVGLTNLSALSLWGNTTNPIPLRITLVKVEDRKYKAVAPTGAPYHISVLLKFKNGWTEGGVARIRTGRTESEVLTMVRWPGNGPDDDTFHGPLTVDIDLENTSSSGIPRGLALAKYGLDQPLEVEGAIGAAPASVENGTPKVSALLPNFPNPFNPETWIPYHLAKASDVQITIYNARGVVVRSLALGRKRAGYYTNRSRAAHWDGRNTFGEKVAAGVYFYQLQADNVSFLRKMVILK